MKLKLTCSSEQVLALSDALQMTMPELIKGNVQEKLCYWVLTNLDTRLYHKTKNLLTKKTSLQLTPSEALAIRTAFERVATHELPYPVNIIHKIICEADRQF